MSAPDKRTAGSWQSQSGWLAALRVDPRPSLLSADDPILSAQARWELLGEGSDPIEAFWVAPEVLKLTKKQQADGCWLYPSKKARESRFQNYNLLETYRQLRLLVEVFRLNREHPTLSRAAEYLLSCQTDEGDVRGILGNQTMPYYHGAILELLIKAGYGEDERVTAGLEWLLSVRQADGGWVVPMQGVPAKLKTDAMWGGEPVVADPAWPSSHLATGMALRAFAAHPAYHYHEGVWEAARLLADRILTADKYNDRKGRQYWLKFQFPFWWSNLLTALDSLSRLNFPADDPQIQIGLDWFVGNQKADGLWSTGYGTGPRVTQERRWVGLAAVRALARF